MYVYKGVQKNAHLFKKKSSTYSMVQGFSKTKHLKEILKCDL